MKVVVYLFHDVMASFYTWSQSLCEFSVEILATHASGLSFCLYIYIYGLEHFSVDWHQNQVNSAFYPPWDDKIMSPFGPNNNNKWIRVLWLNIQPPSTLSHKDITYNSFRHDLKMYRGFSHDMQISCFRRAKNVNSCYVSIFPTSAYLQQLKKDDIVQICRVKVFYSNRSLRNVCWTIFVYNTLIIFAGRKQLCTCAHKLWKGSIVGLRKLTIN